MKSLVRRGAVTELLKELNTAIAGSPRPGRESPDKEALERDQMRQVAKIWTALSKLIRSQCNKGRIIDSLYFGSFGKTSAMRNDENAPKSYTYCPGPRSVFNLKENEENIKVVSQEVSTSS